MNRGATFAVISVCLSAACDDGSGPGVTTGEVRVVTSTTGIDLDRDGYTVALDGNGGQAVEINGSLTLREVPPGDHTVALSGLEINCTANGEQQRPVVVTAGEASEIEFSVTCVEISVPARGRLAFTDGGTSSRAPDIYVVNADGTARTRLTNNGGYYPEWSRDGSRIAFITPARELVVMNDDGTGKVTLTDGLDHDGDRWMTWSPDGTKIAYIREPGRIAVINADGTGAITLTDGPEDYSPSWSPDGQRLVFATDVLGDHEIYVVNANGTDIQQLTESDNIDDSDPAWSPDGSRIAFISTREYDYAENIFTMSPTGDDVAAITSYNVQYRRRPKWSPDGGKLLYEWGMFWNASGRVYGIGALNLDGSPGGLSVWYVRGGAWSPDGAMITYTEDGIMIVGSDGGTAVNVTSGSSPKWGP